LLPKALLVFCP
jgi:hypothetical protein